MYQQLYNNLSNNMANYRQINSKAAIRYNSLTAKTSEFLSATPWILDWLRSSQ